MRRGACDPWKRFDKSDVMWYRPSCIRLLLAIYTYMNMPFLHLVAVVCAAFVAESFEVKAADEVDQINIPKNIESGMGKETAWMIRQTDLRKVWEEIDKHINPLKADRTFPYYSYHIIDGRYYIVVAYVDKEWELHEQWMDVTTYCVAQIPKLQEIGIHVKKAHDILDNITSCEEGDEKASELKEVLTKFLETLDHSDMPPHMFPQLIEYYHANRAALYERIVDTIRKGCYGSKKLYLLLEELIP